MKRLTDYGKKKKKKDLRENSNANSVEPVVHELHNHMFFPPKVPSNSEGQQNPTQEATYKSYRQSMNLKYMFLIFYLFIFSLFF